MLGTHTEEVLNKLSKPELVQLLLNNEDNMGSHIVASTAETKKINNQLMKLQTHVTVTKTVNSRLADQLVEVERQCWVKCLLLSMRRSEVSRNTYLSQGWCTWG